MAVDPEKNRISGRRTIARQLFSALVLPTALRMRLRRDLHCPEVQYEVAVAVELRQLKLDGVRRPYPEPGQQPVRPDRGQAANGGGS